MKLGIVGKGGVGKTTLSALISEAYVRQGKRVVAIDTDSNPNLGVSLGLSLEEMEAVPVLPRSLLVGRDSSTPLGLMQDYGRATPAGATLMSAIRVSEAGAGCTCAGHATVRSFLGATLDDAADVTLIDMEAGLEHLSRSGGTLAHADILLVVMEPSRKSVLTAARTQALAEELGLTRTYALGNKARLPQDAEFFADLCAEYGVPLAGIIPYEPDVIEADRAGRRVPLGSARAVREAIEGVIVFLDGVMAGV